MDLGVPSSLKCFVLYLQSVREGRREGGRNREESVTRGKIKLLNTHFKVLIKLSAQDG